MALAFSFQCRKTIQPADLARSPLQVARVVSPRDYMASTLNSNSLWVDNNKTHITAQPTNSMPPQDLEIVKSLDDWVRNNILIHLKPVEKCWQPQDFLPDPASDGFELQLKELRERAREIPDDYFVVLIGDMITEEALPKYMSMFNRSDAIRDETGDDPTAWATWNRGWTAEENRHSDLLNKYLYLLGRVDMKQIEKTIQYLIGAGMDVNMEKCPYKTLIYASFQERATFVSHANTAKLAQHYGEILCAAPPNNHNTTAILSLHHYNQTPPQSTSPKSTSTMSSGCHHLCLPFSQIYSH